ncbi:putative disease resistance protein RGA3 isoform X1 [Carex rostrata]
MAMVLDAFLPKFSNLLVQMMQEEVGMLLGIPGQIEKLDETVHDIQSVLADAERRQSKSSAIERWLMKLKDVMYDADEVIDLCQIKAKEHQATSSSRSSLKAHCGCHFLSCFRNPLLAHKIGSKIKNINLRLEEIAQSKANLGLTEAQILPGTFDQSSRVNTITWRKTDSSVVLADIAGKKIEEDTEVLVNWLTQEENDVNETVHVYGIVGMGGIGKTTLAQMIYNDPKIQEGFQLKIWVCISKEVRIVEVFKCLIRGAQGDHGAVHVQERSELVPLLESFVQGKKFLFVLDDVWEESQAVLKDWLRAPMSRGAHGSRLLVTTRDGNVANHMGASKSHRVKKLSDEDGWSLLVKQVFQNEKESEIEEFKEIGLQLVEKCDGLPLAIKSIGGVLYMKYKTRDEWQAVLESGVWSKDGLPEDVHRALYLSYEDLSSPLKQCFIFCSLFPEDFLYEKTKIIYMWLAEGFLPNKRDFWNLGAEHYKELVLRNLLEETGITYRYGEKYFKMHDLLWSFARHLGKNENCVLREVSDAKTEGSQKIQRLSIEGNEVNLGVIRKEKGLRTLLLHHGKPEIGLDDLCKALSNLRILDLSESNFSILPNSLCDLMHLRYLNIKNSEVTELPNYIGKLKYLVYLNLSHCSNLSHVPPNIINLKELKFLNILGSSIEKIPVGLKKLDNLVELHGFKPYGNNLEGFSSLDELGTLSNLIILHLQCLEEVSDMNLAKQAKLLNKDQLRDLTLEYTDLSSEEQLSQTNEKKMTTENVLNELCPPLYVEFVRIENYFGTHLPNWLSSRAYLSNLKYLSIGYCACFEEVASLGLLPNLEDLWVSGAHSVVNIGEEFLLGGIQSRDSTTSCSVKPAFPKLRKLNFSLMENWKEWQWNKEQPAMPNLKILVIEYCPHLRSLPEGLSHHGTSLEFLHYNANNLINMGNLKVQTMQLGILGMKTLPEYLTTIMAEELEIYGCTESLLLKIVSQEETGSERIKFKHIPKVTIQNVAFNNKTFLSGALVDSDHS